MKITASRLLAILALIACTSSTSLSTALAAPTGGSHAMDHLHGHEGDDGDSDDENRKRRAGKEPARDHDDAHPRRRRRTPTDGSTSEDDDDMSVLLTDEERAMQAALRASRKQAQAELRQQHGDADDIAGPSNVAAGPSFVNADDIAGPSNVAASPSFVGADDIAGPSNVAASPSFVDAGDPRTDLAAGNHLPLGALHRIAVYQRYLHAYQQYMEDLRERHARLRANLDAIEAMDPRRVVLDMRLYRDRAKLRHQLEDIEYRMSRPGEAVRQQFTRRPWDERSRAQQERMLKLYGPVPSAAELDALFRSADELAGIQGAEGMDVEETAAELEAVDNAEHAGEQPALPQQPEEVMAEQDNVDEDDEEPSTPPTMQPLDGFF